MNDSIFSYIDAAADDGTYTFTTPKAGLPRWEDEKTRKDKLRRLVESHFYGQRLFTLKLELVKKWIDDIEAKGTIEANGDWTVVLNLALFLMLPGKSPKSEQAELRSFLEAMKPYFEEKAGHPTTVSVHNNRDNSGRVYGSLHLKSRDKDEAAAGLHTERLTALVKGSATLEFFMRHTALTLQKLGPWSWVTLSEDQLYGTGEGPGFKLLVEKHRAESTASSAN